MIVIVTKQLLRPNPFYCWLLLCSKVVVETLLVELRKRHSR